MGEITQTADGPALSARVRAVPSDGAANDAVEKLIADWLDVPPRSVRMTSGHRSRVKTLTIDGDTARIAASIAEKQKPEPA